MASCQTSQWGNTSPYVKLTVTESSSTATTSTLSWKLQYIARYAASTSVSKSYTVKINGDTVKSGTYSINGKTGTNTIASGTKTITKTKSSQTISFSISFAFNLEWSGIYKGTLTADDSTSVSAMSKYTITYNPNGGSGAPSSQSQWCTDNLTLSTTKPTRTGYTFLGWSTSSSATSATWSAGGSYTAKVSDTLYAVWKIITYTIKYNMNGGSGTIPDDTKTYGKTLTLSTTKPTRTGYTFLGWSTDKEATKATWSAGGSYTTNKSNTLYAVWKKETYTIKFNPNKGSGAPSDQIKTYGEDLTLSTTKPTRTNYTFLGWSESSTATTASYSAGGTYSSNKNVTLYAVWTLSYFKPKITDFIVSRCDENGNTTGELTHAKATFSWSTSLDVKSVTVTLYNISKTISRSYPISATGKSGSGVTTDPMKFADSNLSIDESYIIEVIIIDDKGTTKETRTLFSNKATIELKSGGNGIAFGKAAEREGYAEFFFKLWSANGEFLSSPIELASETNLNDVLYPGHYIIPQSSIEQTITNRPTSPVTNAATASLDVFVGGSDGQRIQRYTRDDKDDQYVWQRCYYNSSWGEWFFLAGTCAWKNLTLDSAFKSYNDNSDNRPKYKVSGSVVEIKGAVTPASDISVINATKLTIASGIPECLRPSTERTYIAQGSGINKWTFTVQTNGIITAARYGVSSYVAVPSGTWMPFNATYLI